MTLAVWGAALSYLVTLSTNWNLELVLVWRWCQFHVNSTCKPGEKQLSLSRPELAREPHQCRRLYKSLLSTKTTMVDYMRLQACCTTH